MGLFKAVTIQHQLILELWIESGIRVCFAVSRLNPLPIGQQHDPAFVSLKAEILPRITGFVKRISIVPVALSKFGQRSPRVGFAIHHGKGKPSCYGQNIRENRGGCFCQATQVCVRIKIICRKQLDGAETAGQRSQKKESLFHLDVRGKRVTDLWHGQISAEIPTPGTTGLIAK